MASKNSTNNTSPASGRRPTAERTNGDSIRWIGGLLLLFAGLFAVASVLFSFVSWDVDQSILQKPAEERELLGNEVENLCGETGARLGRLLVDDSFGVFGILIPVMVALVGLRIIRQRPLLVNHSLLSLFLILILGSLTLGFAFGDNWSICCSTGWGGAFGIEVAAVLHARIGVFGTLILLLGGWILTGVFINRNFINKVNRAGNAMVDRSGRIVETVRRRVAGRMPLDEPLGGEEFRGTEPAAAEPSEPSGAHSSGAEKAVRERGASALRENVSPDAGEEEIAEAERRAWSAAGAARTTPQSHSGGTAAEHRPSEPFAVERAAAEPEAVRRTAGPEGASEVRISRPAGEEESPFVELTPDGEPLVPEKAASAVPPAAEEEFTEVDLSRPDGRLVMGRGGLVELERPAVRRETVSDGPFTEITVGGGEAPAEDLRTLAERIVAERAGARRDAARPVFEELSVAGTGDAGMSAGGEEPHRAGAPGAGGPDIAEPGAGGYAAARPEGGAGSADGTVPSGAAPEGGMPGTRPETAAAGSVVPGAPASGQTVPGGAQRTEGVVVTVEAREARLVDERRIPTEAYDPLKDLVNYRRPPVTLLEDYVSDSEVSDEEIFENKTRIEETLRNFGIPIQRIKATVGPTVTLYEIVQKQGVKIAKIQGLQNDIAQSLKAESGIRIIAPIPGRGTIGIEVPNRSKQVVSMYSAVRSLRFQESKAELPVVIGRTIQNENFVFDLAKMPHLLVAGATGQGKSVGLNAIITSLLYRKHPAQLKFVMIDPKMVEFSLYAKVERHFLAKMESEEEAIITDPKKAVYTLNSLCTEMDNRLELCKKAGARNIAEYNEKFTARRLNPMNGHRYMPYIVVVIDEFADLIMTAKEVETPVTRLAQKARAIGIHLIIATQRPSVDVITGKIKANFPARIAFRVMQMIDSRTILDRPGADQLIGRGDMLISKDGELTRIQCALVETKEVERIVDYISKQQGYTSAYTLPDYTPESGEGGDLGSEESSAPVKYDSLFAEIARDAVSGGQISTSMIQRNYEVGFNRAGRIMMQLERAGIVGRQQGAKPRDILYHDLPSLEARLQELGLF
ncbi:DNA translocase FtsK 4TM domain-containing protein [Alistipes dispar]|uniref:DNA translocase FtsK n=1 Tax=Alistipes dispar TaxID=2585119 RepID=UPI003BF0F458